MSGQLLFRFLRHHWLFLLVLGGAALFLTVHLVWYIRPSSVKSTEALEARLHNGQQPTVVEFYSNL